MKGQNSKPLVSIIVPTYNGEKRIKATLESIINQDYENLEIIVIDDLSTDSTVQTVREILEHCGRKFKIIERTVNGRQAVARNNGLDAAQGKYVIFFDHDDKAEKNFVSCLCREAEAKNADFVFCGIRHDYELTGKSEYEYIVSSKSYFSTPEEYLTAWAENKISFWSVWNFIFNKNFLVENHLRFTESCYLGDDTEFVMKALCVASKISFVRETFYIYIHHMERSSIKFKSLEQRSKMFGHIMLSRIRIGRFIIRHTESSRIKKYILNFYIPDAIITNVTKNIDDKNYEYYTRAVATLRHKKIRELLLSTSKFLFKKPELFFKALMLICAPKFYYSIRKGKAVNNED